MKITKIFVSVFLLTFLIGSVSILLLKNSFVSTETKSQGAEKIVVETSNAIKNNHNEVEKSDAIFYQTAKTFGGAELLDDDYWENEEDVKYKFEILQTGEFHGDEVAAKSGENGLDFLAKTINLFYATKQSKCGAFEILWTMKTPKKKEEKASAS